MANAIRDNPQSYTLLHAQCDFLRTKGKQDWALKLARQAVNCAPSEFVTWEKLTEVYTDLGQFESALLTLNSCPMFTYNGRDAHRAITPAKINLPYKVAIADILPERRKTEDDEADPALQRLPAPGLKGTWARAYALLAKLVSKIGWDELLKTRSAVFVMEEEYRMQKAQTDVRGVLQQTNGESAGGKVIHEDGTVRDSVFSKTSTAVGGGEEADDDASIKGVMSKESGDLGHSATESEVNLIPTIKISTEADLANEEKEKVENGDANGEVKEKGKEKEKEGVPPETAGLEKPVPSASGDTSDIQDDAMSPAQDGFSFSNKRLCERWLDNLFMILYEVSPYAYHSASSISNSVL